MELNGAQLSMRATLTVVKALPQPLERVWVTGDGEMILACQEKTEGFFTDYFGNGFGECHDLHVDIERLCPVGEAGEWWHASSANNPADRNSRLDSKTWDSTPSGN